MSELDPTRLDSLEGASELSDMVRSARDCAPSDDLVSRLAANLGLPPPAPSGGGGGGGGTVAPPAAPLASGVPAAVVSLKALAAAAAIAAAGVAGLLVFGGRDAPVAPPTRAPIAVTAPPKAVLETAEASAVPQPSPVQTAVAAEREPESPPPSANARASRPVAEKPSEVDLVSRAQKALRSEPALALALTSEHRQLYPRGTLAQEREVLAIEALAALGRADAASARAAAFESANPGSPYAVRVARAVKK